MATTLFEFASGETGFFAPGYRLSIGGASSKELAGDILSLQFKDSIKELSVMELVLNNVQDDGKSQPRFKYSDGGTVIELGAPFSLDIGYADAPDFVHMMSGEITAFDPHFPASGTPTVTIRGLDLLHRLRNKPVNFPWKDMRDSDIATEIARKNGLGSAVVDESTPVHKLVPQENRDDISFLLERAKRMDYEVYMRPDPNSPNTEKLHFVRTREGRTDPVVCLQYGQTLLSFEPSLTLSRMVTKVTVRCWHPEEGRLIEKSADRAKLKELAAEDGPNAADIVEDAVGEGKEEIIITEALDGDEDAEQLAVSILRRKSHSFVTGQGQTVGIPQLRAGVNIELRGLGERFEGIYYVTESTHRIDQSGYQTSFSARKAYIRKK